MFWSILKAKTKITFTSGLAMAEKFSKYFLIWILCAIICKALFPFPPSHLKKTEAVNSTQTANVGQAVIQNYSRISCIETEKYLTFLLFYQWESEETDDEDETSHEDLQEEKLQRRFAVTTISNSPALHFRIVAIPLFILFHSWRHFLA